MGLCLTRGYVEIDPEVAEVLGHLPPTKLPDELLKEGWGRYTMRQASDHMGARLKEPSEIQAPTYTQHCAQCGRPLARSAGGLWLDHAGRQRCDGALVEEQRSREHITVDEVARLEQMLIEIKDRRLRDPGLLPAIKAKPAATKCSATKGMRKMKPGRHVHQCDHADDHFGFHECKYCHHLWR